jgi:hypothetical protein
MLYVFTHKIPYIFRNEHACSMVAIYLSPYQDRTLLIKNYYYYDDPYLPVEAVFAASTQADIMAELLTHSFTTLIR